MRRNKNLALSTRTKSRTGLTLPNTISITPQHEFITEAFKEIGCYKYRSEILRKGFVHELNQCIKDIHVQKPILQWYFERHPEEYDKYCRQILFDEKVFTVCLTRESHDLYLKYRKEMPYYSRSEFYRHGLTLYFREEMTFIEACYKFKLIQNKPLRHLPLTIEMPETNLSTFHDDVKQFTRENPPKIKVNEKIYQFRPNVNTTWVSIQDLSEEIDENAE